MAEITAKMVNELRAKTGQGMMECKKALQEVGGDKEKAVEYFRKKGIKASLGERTATEGRVVGAVSPDKKAATLLWGGLFVAAAAAGAVWWWLTK